MVGFQIVFNDYVVDCVCLLVCFLGIDLVQWVNCYYVLVDLLVQKLGKMLDLCCLSYVDVMMGIINVLYSFQCWKYLISGLLGLQCGSDVGDLLVFVDDYDGWDVDGYYSNDQDVFNVVWCVDVFILVDLVVWVVVD